MNFNVQKLKYQFNNIEYIDTKNTHINIHTNTYIEPFELIEETDWKISCQRARFSIFPHSQMSYQCNAFKHIHKIHFTFR